MDEMIRYIFGSLRCSENTMRVFGKTLHKQKSINRAMCFFAVAVTANVIVREMKFAAIRDEFQNLKKELNEPKNMKGD